MWQDMVLYWAWRGPDAPLSEPPSRKEIAYTAVPGGWIAAVIVEKTALAIQVQLVNQAEIAKRLCS